MQCSVGERGTGPELLPDDGAGAVLDLVEALEGLVQHAQVQVRTATPDHVEGGVQHTSVSVLSPELCECSCVNVVIGC